MWDAVFMGLGATSRRDEGLVAVIGRLAFRVLVNLTMGLLKAVVEFLFSVWRVSELNPPPLGDLPLNPWTLDNLFKFQILWWPPAV